MKCIVCGGRVQNRQNGVSCRVSWGIFPNCDRLIEQPMQKMNLETRKNRTAGAEHWRGTACWWSGWPLYFCSCGADRPEPPVSSSIPNLLRRHKNGVHERYCSGIWAVLRTVVWVTMHVVFLSPIHWVSEAKGKNPLTCAKVNDQAKWTTYVQFLFFYKIWV